MVDTSAFCLFTSTGKKLLDLHETSNIKSGECHNEFFVIRRYMGRPTKIFHYPVERGSYILSSEFERLLNYLEYHNIKVKYGHEVLYEEARLK